MKNVYYTTINLDIFRTAVLVIVSDSTEPILKDLSKIYADFGLKRNNLIEDKKSLEKTWGEDTFMPPGQTIMLPNDTGDVLMVFKEKDISRVSEELIVHETHHASRYICEHRGINDEECEAYVQEHLFNQMLCKIDEWNNNKKKRK